MEWLMVFWVVLIVAVPTVLWFVMFERRRAKEDREKSPGERRVTP